MNTAYLTFSINAGVVQNVEIYRSNNKAYKRCEEMCDEYRVPTINTDAFENAVHMHKFDVPSGLDTINVVMYIYDYCVGAESLESSLTKAESLYETWGKSLNLEWHEDAFADDDENGNYVRLYYDVEIK